MKYRKLTDEEVIKSLECCNLKGNCKHCPCWLGNGKCIAQSMLRGALDLIKRQQAEIEKFKEIPAYYKLPEAIKRQFPKKTIHKLMEIKTDNQSGYVQYVQCPNCRRNINESYISDFCTYCGQALDWSDIE